MTLTELRAKAHNNFLKYRQIETIISNERFEIAFSKNTKRGLLNFVLDSPDDLKDWIEDQLALNEKTYVWLIAEARRRRIKDYCRKTRRQLLKELMKDTTTCGIK